MARPPLLRPEPAPPDEPHLWFQRGKTYPRAIKWLGFTSFWGHLWHLAASVVATEDIDARDWMDALPPAELTRRVARVVGDTETSDGPLTERLERDVWIDYVADTGDDTDVSQAVADMLFRPYLLHDEQGDLEAPRGDVLMFGGDTAYPVATQMEIHNRVCLPFNRVLKDRQDGTPRVLLGIPGNHDWYDGLDGFARMFRTRPAEVGLEQLKDDRVDTAGAVGHLIDWVEAFRSGGFVAKRTALPLIGYTPVQHASYFAIALAPHLDWWAVDRQLRAVDYSQRSFFGKLRDAQPDHGLWVCIADPMWTMLEKYSVGQGIMKSLTVSLEDDEPLVTTGDTHHFCRLAFGRALHVVAGGGGAFLHPARILRKGLKQPEAEFPGPRASFALALGVPWQIAGGRAGFVVHTGIAAMYLPVLGLHISGESTAAACAIIAVISTGVCGLLGGWRRDRALPIAALAGLCGAWVGFLPFAARWLVAWLADGRLTDPSQALLSFLLCIYPATLGFGTYLMMLTITGLEHNQAFSSLGHPGYKHFMRLRVKRDGSRVDGWVIGKVDTLDEDAHIHLIDHWTWNNPRHPSNADATPPPDQED